MCIGDRAARPGVYAPRWLPASGWRAAERWGEDLGTGRQAWARLGFRDKESEASEAGRNPARGDKSPRCLRAKPCRAGLGILPDASRRRWLGGEAPKELCRKAARSFELRACGRPSSYVGIPANRPGFRGRESAPGLRGSRLQIRAFSSSDMSFRAQCAIIYVGEALEVERVPSLPKGELDAGFPARPSAYLHGLARGCASAPSRSSARASRKPHCRNPG